jgi:ribosomal protein S18 acetylase RimI-like enzyme
MNENQKIVCHKIRYNTNEYKQTVALREEILRKPLNLEFSTEELERENDSFHLACWKDSILVAGLVLKPVTDQQIRLRQLAVKRNFQNKGIGRILMNYSESFAKSHGFREIVMHARETAVGFYEKLGYKREGEKFIEVTIPHFMMWKILKDY